MNVYLVINHWGLLETSTVPFSVVCCGSACLVKNSEFVHIEMTETGFSISEKKTDQVKIKSVHSPSL